MKNVLVSWLDYRFDFEKDHPHVPAPNGMTWRLHRYYMPEHDCDRHYLLSMKASQPEDKQMNAMLQRLGREFPAHRITPVYMNIPDPIDLAHIKDAVESFLLDLRNDSRVNIFYNAGYQMMQLAWVLCCLTSCRDFTRLFHMRKPEFTESGRPEMLEIDLAKQQSTQAYGLLMHTRGDSRSADTCITPAMQSAYYRAEQVASLPRFPALITGPSGSGKEQLARHIHHMSGKGRFMAVNCAAMPDELLRAELFGYKKGAFTGAVESRAGYFEVADGGTLFLDEIGDASLLLQQSLLRVLQDGLITPLGDTRPRKVNVRIIAATHRNLPQMIAQGRFRDDLYYRLNPAPIRLPAWADLPEEDRRQLFTFLWEQQAQKLNHGRKMTISSEAADFIIRCNFPGNIRQLQNLIAGLYVFYRHEPRVTIEMVLHELDNGGSAVSVHHPVGWHMEDMEKAHIQKALQHFRNNLTHTAKALGISLNTLKAKMKKLHLA